MGLALVGLRSGLVPGDGISIESRPSKEGLLIKAAVMRGVGDPLLIEDVVLAEPGPYEVLVKTVAAGLCHSDLRFIEGSFPLPLPAVLGHESAGVVEQVGKSVTHVAPGDHVITFLTVFCGSCSFCLTGRSYLCDNREATQRRRDEPPRILVSGEPAHQFLDLASFSEKMLVHEHAVVKIADDMPLDRASLLGCGVATGLGAVFNTAGVRPGEAVAVVGCGGVGLSAIQGARIAGANTIIAIDLIDEKLGLAKSLGATHLINATSGTAAEQVLEITAGRGVHHAFEAIGSTQTAELAFSMLRRGGTATVIGLIPSGEKVSVPSDDLFWEKKLQGSVMGSNRFKIDVPRYVEMYLDGRLDLDNMISNRLDLADINDGFARIQSGQGARNVIMFDTAG